jgi:predicted nucleotidyltransferase component of viral defense system
MHLEILDQKRKDLLPIFTQFKSRFYLAGGTALALQIGHRQSVDFDFFTDDDIDTEKLFEEIRECFKTHDVTIYQEEKNTLGILIDSEMKVSFMKYGYSIVSAPIDTDFFRLASILDIGLMKLSAITSRAELKDYVDVFFILKQISLQELLEKNKIKHPALDEMIVLKSLTFFEDINMQEIIWQKGFEISFDEIKKDLILSVSKVLRV